MYPNPVHPDRLPQASAQHPGGQAAGDQVPGGVRPAPADMVPLAGVTGEVAEEDAGIDVYQNGAHTCWIT